MVSSCDHLIGARTAAGGGSWTLLIHQNSGLKIRKRDIEFDFCPKCGYPLKSYPDQNEKHAAEG